MADDAAALEMEIYELTLKLHELRKATPRKAVPNYSFATQTGETTLLDLFAGRDKLLMIHNMGQGCRYCTLWADGFNGQLDHLEDAMSVVLVSKDDPQTQRRFANSRGWKFRLASHGGGAYISEQTVMKDQGNFPGAVVYERVGDEIFRLNSGIFGPGDQFCALWSLLSLGGVGESDWMPQYRYWQRPAQLDDGGEGVVD